MGARRAAIPRTLATPRSQPAAPGGVRLSVVVPAYREAAAIGATVARIRSELAAVADHGGLEVVVVDDGSGDGTAAAARSADADQVLEFPENRGKGAAVRAGMLAALLAIIVGTLSTLKRKGLLTSQEIDQLFEAGLVTFERGEQDETRQAARLTLEILARSLRD